jgi:hypothetical protein
MNATTEFTIGSEVSCSNGACGELRRVVINPVALAVTHLVVEAKHRRGTGHLVPIDLVDSSTESIRLKCTTAEFDALEHTEHMRLLPVTSGLWGYGREDLLAQPYYGLAVEGAVMGGSGLSSGREVTTYDRVPLGEVQVCRGERVQATDGAIGQVQGLVVEPSDHHVTHVLLDEGHLWGKKRVAIPITAVADVDDGVRLKLSKDEVRDLPPVDLAPGPDQGKV